MAGRPRADLESGLVDVLTSRVSCRPRLGLASSSRPHQEDQDPRSDGRPGAPRPQRVSCDDSWGGLTAKRPLRLLRDGADRLVPGGEFSTGSVVETETAKGLTE